MYGCIYIFLLKVYFNYSFSFTIYSFTMFYFLKTKIKIYIMKLKTSSVLEYELITFHLTLETNKYFLRKYCISIGQTIKTTLTNF